MNNKKLKLKIGMAAIIIFLGFLIWPSGSFAASCEITRVDTDKDSYYPANGKETVQVTIQATNECIGQPFEILLCETPGGCRNLDTEVVTGLPVVYPYEIKAVPTEIKRHFFQVQGPSNTDSSLVFRIFGKDIQTDNITFSLNETPFKVEVGVPIDRNNNLNVILGVKGGAPPYSWEKESGKLPDGLNLSRDGFITGTPRKEGSFSFYVKIEDKDGNKTTPRKMNIEVVAAGTLQGAPGLGGPPDQPGPPGPGGQFPGVNLTIQVLEQVINNLVCWIYRVAFALIVIFIVFTGIQYLAYSGNPTKITAVHQSFKWVIIGSAVILGVGVIIATITAALGLPFIAPVIC